MAAAPVNTKIILKSNTKISLNERFTAYREQAQTVVAFRKRMQMGRQASSANLRLAQQMANRPTVLAALRLKRRSLQQRLGNRRPNSNNVKSRLTMNRAIVNRLGNVRGRSRNRRGGFKSGISPLLKDRLGMRKGGGFRNMGFGNQRARFRNFRSNRQSRGGNRQQMQQRSNARGGRSRGRGKGWWGGNKVPGNVPTKQELDNQLDEYMAETKSGLDTQIGQYMTQG